MTRHDPGVVRAARLRARIMAARAARLRPGIRAEGRVAGRLARDLAPLDPAMDCAAPALALIPEPALAARIFEAGAAALMADRVASAITPDRIAALDISPEARDFALRHRALSLPGNDSFDALMQRLVALWAADLPAPLSAEYAPGPAPAPMPVAAPAAPPQPRRRWRRAGVVLPLAPVAAVGDRHRAALDAAMAALLPQVQA